MNKQSFLALVIPLITALFISGCSILPEPEAITSYQLTQSEITPTKQPINTTLRINKPHASGLMTSTRVLVQPNPQELNIYHGALWHEPTPTLVQNYLFDAFNQAGIIDFVYKDSSYLINTQYELDSDLRSFQAIKQDHNNLVRITLAVRLVESKPKTILATKVFTQELPVDSLEINQLIAAFSQAQDQLTKEILVWTQNYL